MDPALEQHAAGIHGLRPNIFIRREQNRSFNMLSTRLLTFGLFSVGMAIAVLISAWQQNRHFYAAGVHVSRSGASMLALMNVGILFTALVGKALQRLIFGPLRSAEVEHLYERSWLTVTELLLAMTIFRDEFDAKFAVFLTIFLFLKAFHWITVDRVNFMEHSPNILLFSHLKLQAFIGALLTADFYLITLAYESFKRGPSVMILFGFEYVILASTMTTVAIKYAANLYDMRQEHGWEAKSIWLFYLDLLHDFVKLVSYLSFFVLIVFHYGLPLHIIRDLYLTMRSFLLKVRDLWRYRRATRNMEQRYPTATAADFDRIHDRTCIICREDMYAEGEALPSSEHAQAANNNNPSASTRPSQLPKILPCGHIFHFQCVRNWLERQPTCPTCRRPLLDTNYETTPDAARFAFARFAQPPAQQAQPAQPQNNRPQASPAANTGDARNTAERSPTRTASPTRPPATPAAQPAPSSSNQAARPSSPTRSDQNASRSRLLSRVLEDAINDLPLPPPPHPPTLPVELLQLMSSSNAAGPTGPAPLNMDDIQSFSSPNSITNRTLIEKQLHALSQIQSQITNAMIGLSQILSVMPPTSTAPPQSSSSSSDSKQT